MPRARQPAIVGVYLTRQARSLPGRTSQDLVIEAVKGAIADAGLAPREVDGVAVDWPGPGGAPGDSANWAMYLQATARLGRQSLHGHCRCARRAQGRGGRRDRAVRGGRRRQRPGWRSGRRNDIRAVRPSARAWGSSSPTHSAPPSCPSLRSSRNGTCTSSARRRNSWRPSPHASATTATSIPTQSCAAPGPTRSRTSWLRR